jgi:hypothetical protein
MSCSDQNHRARPLDAPLLGELLSAVRERFYATKPAAQFHRDRRGLIRALSWPADWLERRGLFCSSSRYRALVVARLDAIRTHGDPARYGAFFPSYLLKCLQDHFAHHGEELHDELKHIRNALEAVAGSLRFAESEAAVHARKIDALARVHRLLRAQAPPPSDPRQLALF